MGAMQAQDYAMAKWAIGVRLPNSTDKIVAAAIDKGEIIRTHLMRPTWHFVSSDDIYWMLDLTAAGIKNSMKSRHEQMGLTKSVFSKTAKIIEKELRDENHLTRDELVLKFNIAGISTGNNRASHIFFRLELDQLICSGSSKNGKPTYALLEERVPKKKSVPRDDALARLAGKYFSSHGPATLNDFIWWSGLSVKDARLATETVKDKFTIEQIDSQFYFFPDSFPPAKSAADSMYLLPAFDEFIISYKDRKASLTSEDHTKAVSNNGIFHPVIVSGGEVIGTWRRTVNKNKIEMETKLFNPAPASVEKKVERAFGLFKNFLNGAVKSS